MFKNIDGMSNQEEECRGSVGVKQLEFLTWQRPRPGTSSRPRPVYTRLGCCRIVLPCCRR